MLASVINFFLYISIISIFWKYFFTPDIFWQLHITCKSYILHYFNMLYKLIFLYTELKQFIIYKLNILFYITNISTLNIKSKHSLTCTVATSKHQKAKQTK